MMNLIVEYNSSSTLSMQVSLLIRISLQWRNNGRDGVTNHHHRHCSLNRLFGSRSKKTSKLLVTGLCAGHSPVTGEFPAKMASNAEMFPFDDVIMILRPSGPLSSSTSGKGHLPLISTLPLFYHADIMTWKHIPHCWPFGKESTGHRWIPPQRTCIVEFDMFCY